MCEFDHCIAIHVWDGGQRPGCLHTVVTACVFLTVVCVSNSVLNFLGTKLFTA